MCARRERKHVSEVWDVFGTRAINSTPRREIGYWIDHSDTSLKEPSSTGRGTPCR
jgi:hypothetical protein